MVRESDRGAGPVASVPPLLLLGARLGQRLPAALEASQALLREAVRALQVVQVGVRLPRGGHDVHGAGQADRVRAEKASGIHEVRRSVATPFSNIITFPTD